VPMQKSGWHTSAKRRTSAVADKERIAITEPLLSIKGIETCYGRSQVLFGVTMEIRLGEVVTLLGRNGMGKTTTVRSIMGLTPPARGSIRFQSREIGGLPSYRVAQGGIGLVPEGRQIFPNLTVRENLVATAANRANVQDRWTLDKVFSMFPRLGERWAIMGGQLSGGEQQMLAIGRALMTNPTLLILDEATEGLAPLVREEIWACMTRLKQLGYSILLIDKNIDSLLEIADRHYILEKGRVVWHGNSLDIDRDERVRADYLSI
jgi:branched-chain amino acid transport system ATP-binding protein